MKGKRNVQLSRYIFLKNNTGKKYIYKYNKSNAFITQEPLDESLTPFLLFGCVKE